MAEHDGKDGEALLRGVCLCRHIHHTKKPALWQVQLRSFQAKGTNSAKAPRQDKFSLFRELKGKQCSWSRVSKGRKAEMRSESWWPDRVGKKFRFYVHHNGKSLMESTII